MSPEHGSTPGSRTCAFPKEARVRKRREFLQIQNAGRRVATRHFLVVYACSGDGPPSRTTREDFPGAWHHIMNRGVARTSIFADDADRRSLLLEAAQAFSANAIELHAFCLMGNHYHLLVRSLDGRLPTAMQRWSSRYTYAFNRRHGRDGPLFRGRYASIGIASDAHLLQALRYIHLNPVETGGCVKAEDWPWSSARGYFAAAMDRANERPAARGQTQGSDPFGNADRVPLITSELLAMFGSLPAASYCAFMQAGIDEATKSFYRDMQTGNERWI